MDTTLTTINLSGSCRDTRVHLGRGMHVPRHAFHGVVATSGAGRETRLRILCGLRCPTAGACVLYVRPNRGYGIPFPAAGHKLRQLSRIPTCCGCLHSGRLGRDVGTEELLRTEGGTGILELASLPRRRGIQKQHLAEANNARIAPPAPERGSVR